MSEPEKAGGRPGHKCKARGHALHSRPDRFARAPHACAEQRVKHCVVLEVQLAALLSRSVQPLLPLADKIAGCRVGFGVEAVMPGLHTA